MYRQIFLSVCSAIVSLGVVSAEFVSADINSGIAGNTVQVGMDGFDVTASGADIWGNSDGLRFHYQEVTGDFDIRARVSSVQSVNPWSKAGVAIRQSLAANSIHAMTVATPGNGFAFQYRSAEGGTTSNVAGGGTYYPFSWVRLVRIGQVVKSYKSVDPTADEWDLIGSTSLTSDPVYVGLVVTSHNNAALCKAEFRNVDLHAYVQPVSGTGDGLSASYFNSKSLLGASVLSRVDPKVDFNWATSSPEAAVNPDNFSVRWSGQVQAQYSEEYTFFTVSDDGVRLWLNGNLIVDHWTDHSRTENRAYPISLVAGQKYDLVMEFFENGGNAEARLMWASRSTIKEAVPQSQLYSNSILPIEGSGTGLKGEYFAGREFGTKVLTRVDSTVDFTWGTSAPSPVVGSNDFAVRWTGLVEPKFTGQYTFHTISDDGVRLWIDNRLVINNWTDHSATENSGAIALSAGKKYPIRIEFYENGGNAVAKLLWSSVGQVKEVIPASQLYPGQGTGLFAEYFDNDDFTNLKFTRIDPVIDFDWASSSPASSIEADSFSVRWTGRVEPLYSESYTFYTVSNDSVRLWVNGQLVIDNWVDHATVEGVSASIALNAGVPVDLKMEFKESTGDAEAKLLWASASQVKQVISSTQLHPNGGLLVDIPMASAVSPAFIEGTCWSPTQQSFTIEGNGASVTLLANTRFFSNLPLDSSQPTPITFTHSGTGVSASGSILWVSTDIAGKTFSNNQLLLRKGDSLLLSVSGLANEPIAIDANGDGASEYTGISGDNFQYQFQTPGIFIVTGIKNGTLAGNVLVKVVDVNLEKPIACAVGFNRRKHVVVTPTQLRPEVFFGTNDSSLLDVQPLGFAVDSIDGDVAAISLRAKQRGTPVLLSRLGSSSGPIVAYRDVDEFTTTKESLIGGTFNAEDGLGGAELLLHPFVPNIRFEFKMFAHTATFEDGSTTLSVNTSDIDPETGDPYFETYFDPITNEVVGRYTVRMFLPEGETKYCFTSAAYQSSSDEQEVEAKANNNGDPCIARADKLVLCVGDKGKVQVTLVKRKNDGKKHDLIIAAGPAGASRPKFTKPEPDAEKCDNCFDCAAASGTLFEEEVSAVGATPGKYDLKIGNATFKDTIEVLGESDSAYLRTMGVYSPDPMEFSADGGGVGPNVFVPANFEGRFNLGVAPIGEGNNEYDSAVNLVEVVGVVCGHQTGDTYSWKRRTPPMFGDVTPSATKKVYDADNPRIVDEAYVDANQAGEVVVFKFNFTQTLFRSRGGANAPIAVVKWHSVNSMIRISHDIALPFNQQWKRGSIDNVGEGHIKTSCTEGELQSLVGDKGKVVGPLN